MTSIAAASRALKKSIVSIIVNGIIAKQFVDSSSEKSYIHLDLIQKSSIKAKKYSKVIGMTSASPIIHTVCSCIAEVYLENKSYNNVKFQ